MTNKRAAWGDKSKWNGRGDSPQRGTATVSVSASDTGSEPVTFDPPFSDVPTLTLIPGGTTTFILGYTGKTAAGFTVNVRRFDGAPVTASFGVDWTAEL